jgi:lysozyme
MTDKLLGIDISHDQPAANWAAVKAGGVAFVFIKATEGTNYTDPSFAEHWVGAGGVGLPRGPYHFFRPAFDALLQATAFVAAIQADPGELPPMVDLEDTDAVTNDARIQAVATFLNEVQTRLGRTPILYTGASWWNTNMRSSAGQYPAWAQNYILWVAQYPWDPIHPKPAQLASLPALPVIQATGGQAIPIGFQEAWTVWQFTGLGQINGINSAVDMDLFSGALADLLALAHGPLHIQNNGNGTAPATFAGRINQDVINVFYKAAAKLTAGGTAIGGWDLVTKAGQTNIGIPEANRLQKYAGPAIAGLPGLNNHERAALTSALQASALNPEPSNGHLKSEIHALPGLHGPADPGWGWVPPAFDAITQSKVHAVKVLAPDVQLADLAGLHGVNGGPFILARLFNAQMGQQQGDGTPEAAALWFANQVADPGDGNSPMNRAYNAGVRYFEVHNEPNLVAEGLGTNWADGDGFARFFQTAVALLKPRYPGAKFGFPGLSPGAARAGVRPITTDIFWTQAQPAIVQADFVGCHVYWGREGVSLADALAQLEQVCDRFADRRVLCTEFSNNDPAVTRQDKAAQYSQFYTACQALPSNLGAMFAYVLSSNPDPNGESFLAWNVGTHKWDGTPMAGLVGQNMP